VTDLAHRKDLTLPVKDFGEVSLLLAPAESHPEAALADLKERLLQGALGDGQAPPSYVQVLRNRLHDQMTKRFMAELKIEPRAGAEVTVRQGAQTHALLLHLEQLLSKIADRLDRHATPPAAPRIDRLHLPYEPNPLLVGRDRLLELVRMTFESKGRPVVLHGLGGVGKTQAAIAYASRHDGAYTHVIWLSADSKDTLDEGCGKLARLLRLVPDNEAKRDLILSVVRSWLAGNPGWLVILDNADDPRTVREYLPPSKYGHTLITSRNPNWGYMAVSLEVSKLSEEDGGQFLLERTGLTDRESALALARELDGLPLALEQAGAYVEATGGTLARYLERYREQQTILVADKTNKPADYDQTVATTWEIAFIEVEKNRAAVGLMNLAAFLAPDEIPLAMVREQASVLPEPLDRLAGDEDAMAEAVRVLRRYSLATGNAEKFSVHRLVQAVVQHRMSTEGRQLWTGVAVRLMAKAFNFDENDLSTWPVCAELLPHARSAAEHARGLGVEGKATGHLLNETGLYLSLRADFLGARAVLEQALLLHDAEYGGSHPEVAAVLSNLGSALLDLGELQGAKAHLERALAIDEVACGANHPMSQIVPATSVWSWGNWVTFRVQEPRWSVPWPSIKRLSALTTRTSQFALAS
jgi:tetratricopeptide (TPR) repeat protein